MKQNAKILLFIVAYTAFVVLTTYGAVFSSSPQKFNEQEFDFPPLYEVIPDE